MKVTRCPGCKADLRGSPIPDKYFVHDRNSEEHKRSVEVHKRYNLTGECTCLPYGDLPVEDRFYSKIIGVEIKGVYDGVLFWQCPECGAQWHRWNGLDQHLYKRAKEAMTKEVKIP